MKLHGRITLFGEYLSRNNLSYCCSLKSKLFLSNDEHEKISHPFYLQSKDKIIPTLKKYGVTSSSTITGNLPLGFGMSSSTILSMLHLDSISNKELIIKIDKEMCGFSPSELDYISITKQESGLFGFGKWLPISLKNLNYSIIIFPKEKERNLNFVIQSLQENSEKLTKLANQLSLKLITLQTLDLDILFQYSKELLSTNVYSKLAKEISSSLIKDGLICKAIGGLYDKAMIVVYRNEIQKLNLDNYISNSYSNIRIVE